MDTPSAYRYKKITDNMDQYRKTPRASFLNYENGTYFVTICTRDKVHSFGEIVNGEMQLSRIGAFAHEQLAKANEFNAALHVPLFVVMPNHVHAIICVNADRQPDGMQPAKQRDTNPCLRANPTCQRHVPTLSRYISSFKGAVTKFARMIDEDFGWQGRFHDHLIRGTKDGNKISDYIENNVARWSEDCFNAKS